jgi:hypothetical protein
MSNTNLFARHTPLTLLPGLFLCGVIVIALSGAGTPAGTGPSTGTEREVLSFEMWCLEVQAYPPMRCDARRGNDVKDYETYRTTIEKFSTQRSEQERRDQALQEQLNRSPGTTKR